MSESTSSVKANIHLTGNECRALFKKMLKEPETSAFIPGNIDVRKFKNIVQIMKEAGFTVEVNRHQKNVVITGFEGRDFVTGQMLISWIGGDVKEVGYIVWKTPEYILSQVISRSNVIGFSFDVTESREKVSVVHMELKTSGAKSHAARDNFLNIITALKREGKKISWNINRTESADIYTDFEAELDLVSMMRLRNSINSAA